MDRAVNMLLIDSSCQSSSCGSGEMPARPLRFHGHDTFAQLKSNQASRLRALWRETPCALLALSGRTLQQSWVRVWTH
jgi:hypothetical protein